MSVPTSAGFVCGNNAATSRANPAPHRPRGGRPAPAIAANPLERLAQLMRSNERLMDDLAASRARLETARAYLDEPGGNAPLGTAHLDRCRVKHSGILARLRGNRIEAFDLLGRDGSEG